MTTTAKTVLSVITTLLLFAVMGIAVAASAAEVIPGKLEPIIIEPPDGKPFNQCVIGGCSGQLCVSRSKSPIYSTCEWKEEYACYKAATCEVQPDGECGWSMTEELKSCLGGGTLPIEPPPIEPACNGICEADDICHRDVVCVWEGKCPSDCPNGYPPKEPVCGNHICEAGEAESSYCPPCKEAPCPLAPCYLEPGTCPQDCRGLTPTPKPSPQICTLMCIEGELDEETCTCVPDDDTPPSQCDDSGGTWRQFPNGCADNCSYTKGPHQVCTQATTESCDCGPGSCWNGSECEANPRIPLPQNPVAQQALFRIFEFLSAFTDNFPFRFH